MTSLPVARLLRALVVLLSAVLAGSLAGSAAFAATQDEGDDTPDTRVIDILPVEGLIDPPVAAAIRDAVVDANARGSELVVLQLDSPGTVSADLDGLVDLIRSSDVPVAVYVGPQTARAELRGGGLLLLGAAHVRVVAPDAVLGPLDPLDIGGDPAGVVATGGQELARLWPELADTGAGARLSGADGGAVTADDIEGAVDLVAAGLQPLLVDLDGKSVSTAGGDVELRIRSDELDVRFLTLGLVRRMLHAATTPAFIYLLFTIGLAMLLFEVFQPGFGVAGIAGIITAGIGVFGLTVLPVAWWAVALVVVGLLLYALDTAVAGFGAVTVAATAAFAAGSWWFYDSPVVGLPAWLVVLNTVAALGFFVIVMTVVLRAQAGPEDAAVEDLVGKLGIVRSVLNPEGHVYIDDALWRARWTGEAKRAKVGTPIRVHAVDGPVVLVEPFDPETARAARSSESTSGD
jgi:membrane-bound serine protease (ClpP class)